MNELLQSIEEFFTVERLAPIAIALLRMVAIMVAAAILGKLISRFVTELRGRIVKMMRRQHGDESTLELEQRAATIGGVIRKTAIVVVWVLALAMGLREVGFDIAPILAGAGVVGLAVGFGAQNLVRDVITGLFMLMENQISENDIAIINGTGGLVEQINLRTTVLRGLDGTMHIFPNGAITSLSNMTREFSFYVFDVGVAYKEDTDRVVEVLQEISENMRQEEEFRRLILEPLDVLGVDRFGDSAVIVKVRLKTAPGKQWQVGRAMNRRIKQRFDEEGIEIPFPHRSLYFGDAGMPFKVQLDGSTREELKAAVREVMEEMKNGSGKSSDS